MSWSYNRCSGCSHEHRQVMPNGPVPARILGLGEGPGNREDLFGRPFCGPSGQELDETYLRLAGLDRSDIFMSNAVQCRQERNGVDVKPGEKLLQCCATNHLPEEFAAVQPEIVLLFGATACSLVGRIDLELEHGIPRRLDRVAAFGGWSGIVVPMYHPAAGMHLTRLMIPLLEDFEKLGLWLRGKWTPPTPEDVQPKYKLLEHYHDWRLMIPEKHWDGWAWVDTESDESKPYSRQISFQKGVAGFILESNQALIDETSFFLNECAEGVGMHNAAYDHEELDSCGVHPKQMRDTMQELYHLGHLPQALKKAVFRVFGFRMTSYDEVVTPYSKAKLNDWLAEALAVASSDLRTIIPHPPGPNCPTCGKKHRLDVPKAKDHPSEAVLRRIMGKMDEGDTSEYDPWEMPKWSKGVEKPRLIGRDWFEELELAVGRMPRKSLVHAPLDMQVKYGCGDADWTGRLAAWLESERARIVQEEWKVA